MARSLLVDPWFGNPNSPRGVDAQERCDVLLLTHGHFDHFDATALSLARRLHPSMPCVHELSLYLLAQLGDAAEVDRDERGRHGRDRTASG